MMAEGMEGIKAGMQASASTTRAGETYERTASLATDAKALAKADSATKKSDQELLFSSSTGGNSGHPYPAHSYSTPYPAHPYYHSPPPFLPVHQPPESSLTRLVNNLKSIYYELRYEFQRLLDFSWMTNLFRPNRHNVPNQPHAMWGPPIYTNYHVPYNPVGRAMMDVFTVHIHPVTRWLGICRWDLMARKYWTVCAPCQSQLPSQSLQDGSPSSIYQKRNMYRAFAQLAHKDQRQDYRVEYELRQYIAQNPERFRGYLTSEDAPGAKIYAGGRYYRLWDDKWGNGVEVAAFSELHRVNLLVVSKSSKSVHVHRQLFDQSNKFHGILLQGDDDQLYKKCELIWSFDRHVLSLERHGGLLMLLDRDLVSAELRVTCHSGRPVALRRRNRPINRIGQCGLSKHLAEDFYHSTLYLGWGMNPHLETEEQASLGQRAILFLVCRRVPVGKSPSAFPSARKAGYRFD
ncbi:hypothetical protein H4Q26_009936 [Puccinia striiformis f. sp. tritici PST-130]|nr:hypothetical protein H4Q26_009936 [Puccinia striiformis f. sp. tritici PST-130]